MTHVINVESFGKALDFCTGYGEKYNPGSPKLRIPFLTAQLIAAKQAMEAVSTARSIFDTEANARRQGFEELGSLASRILLTLESSGAKPEMIADAKHFVRQLRGYTPKGRAPIASAESQETKARKSMLQLGYASKVDWFGKLLKALEHEASYKPNEPMLTASTLSAKVPVLNALNVSVHQARVNYSNAIIERNRILYADGESLYTSMVALKKYVRALFGNGSAEYAQVKVLRFIKTV